MHFKVLALIFLLSTHLVSCGQTGNTQKQELKNSDKPMKEQKMKIEIWSDIMCPFCYMGKRKFETALSQFPHKDKIEVVWKSYLLSPDIKTDPTANTNEWLAGHIGVSVQQVEAMNNQVAQQAKQSGLTYNMDKVKLANTFNAHRSVHFAKQYGKHNEMKEVLFRSYFTDGKNIDDYQTIIQLGKEINLDADALKTALENNAFSDEVIAHINEARQLNINGVPYFLFNRKYAVNGAQQSQKFLEILEKSFTEWQKENPQNDFEVTEGNVCKPDGKCD